MSTIGALSHAIQPLGITAMATRREVTAREFHAQLRDALLANPDRFAQLGQAMQSTLQAIFPTLPERVAYESALAHIKLALTRADLPELPAALVRPRLVPPGRAETRRERRARIFGAAKAVVEQTRAATTARYAEYVRSWYGIAGNQPKVTIR
jgi:hypothetical protein